nr:MAG TPA: hypothetical protein [Caudoviricetes sp.]
MQGDSNRMDIFGHNIIILHKNDLIYYGHSGGNCFM